MIKDFSAAPSLSGKEMEVGPFEQMRVMMKDMNKSGMFGDKMMPADEVMVYR